MPKIIEPPLHEGEIIQKKQASASRRMKILIFSGVALVLFFAVVGGALWAVSYFEWPGFVYAKFFTERPPKLWAVYLSAGNTPTTYYGEIAKWGKEYIVVKNPAYVDVRQPQEGTTGEPTVTFRRLSEEFYRPKPEAKIFRQNIIFLQELAADSPIHEAYKQSPAR
ncbi:MAG: hypothetical protein Q8L57_02170 [bacterium]|nr:hypothetical protein [bacterium]